MGCADWWHGVGSMSLYLDRIQYDYPHMSSALAILIEQIGLLLLLSKEISKVCNSVFRIPHQLRFGLSTLEFFAVDIGQDARNLAI